MIRPIPHIAAMSPYALAKLKPPAGKRLISLAQNESLRPPSPNSVKAAAEVMQAGHLYPDPDWVDLRDHLAALHGLQTEQILCGCGSMDLIASIARTFAGPNRAVLAPVHAYPFFRTAAQLAGARFDTAPEKDLQVDVDALLAAVRPDTGILFVANPGNPTGTRIARTELVRLRDQLSEDILLVIDEAYGEFADHLAEPVFDLVSGGGTVVLRSFSKAYGLAGSRVGWGVFPSAVAAELRKVLNPNNVTTAAQAAATGALADQAYMRETVALTQMLRNRFSERLRANRLDVLQSLTNFVLINFGSAKRAARADAALRREGVFLRPQGGVGLNTCLRATIGQEAELELAAEILDHWARGQG